MSLIEDVGLVDFLVVDPKPIWVNNFSSSEAISKRIDNFLIHRNIFVSLGKVRSWLDGICISNHFPIYLEFDGLVDKPGRPYKFILAWILDREFIKLVKDNQRVYNPSSTSSSFL